MKFKIENKQLFSALGACSNVVGGLDESNCLVETGKDCIVITAKSDIVWVKYKVPAIVEKKGKFCTLADTLASLKLSGKESEFTLKKHNLHIKSGRTNATFTVGPLDELDVEPDSKLSLVKDTFTFHADSFNELVSSMNYDSDIIEKTSDKVVNFRSDGKSLKISTNDRYCMAYAGLEHNASEFEAVVSLDMLLIISSFISGEFQFGVNVEKELMVFIGKEFQGYLRFSQPEANLFNADIEIQKLKKEEPEMTASLSKDNFDSLMNEVLSFSKAQIKDARVKLSFNKTKKKVTFSVVTTYGNIENELDLSSISSTKSFVVPLYLFLELTGCVAELNFKYYGKKFVVQDSTNFYIMPTL